MFTLEGTQQARLDDSNSGPDLQIWYTWLPLLLAAVLYFFLIPAESGNQKIVAPIVGSQFSWIARWRFFSDASQMIDEGYSKVKVPDCSGLRRADALTVQTSYIQT